MKEITESLEKYLIAIYELSQKQTNIIVKDVANHLGYGGASTSNAIKTLAQKGYINYVPYGPISLAAKGQNAVTVKIYRHRTIAEFLNRVLEIEKDKAEENANAIEYSMTEDVLTKLVHFLDFMNQCTCQEPKWLNGCKHSLNNGDMPQSCAHCTSGCGKCKSCH